MVVNRIIKFAAFFISTWCAFVAGAAQFNRECRILYQHLNRDASVGQPDFWPLDFDGTLKGIYDDGFRRELAPYRSFDELAIARRQRGQGTHVLDFAGSAAFSRRPELYDSLTGFRLGPGKHDPQVAFAEKHYRFWREIYGNAFDSKYWPALRDRKYDIVIAHPVAGVNALWTAVEETNVHEEALHGVLRMTVDRLWRLTSSNDGMIFLNHIPISGPPLDAWIARCRALGVVIHRDTDPASESLVIIKSKTSPRRLPL